MFVLTLQATVTNVRHALLLDWEGQLCLADLVMVFSVPLGPGALSTDTDTLLLYVQGHIEVDDYSATWLPARVTTLAESYTIVKASTIRGRVLLVPQLGPVSVVKEQSRPLAFSCFIILSSG